MRTIVRKQRRHEGIGHRLQRTVGKREDEHADRQHLVGIRRIRRPKGDEGRQHVRREGQDHEFAVADLVGDHAADDDTEAETGEARATDGAELRGREAELFAPIVEDTAANGETDARGENGREAGPEQALSVGRNALVADLFVTHRCGIDVDGYSGGNRFTPPRTLQIRLVLARGPRGVARGVAWG